MFRGAAKKGRFTDRGRATIFTAASWIIRVRSLDLILHN